MRKIFGSLIVVTALVSMGVLATGAYFSTTAPLGPVTLTTGTPSLNVSFYTAPVIPALIAPGFSNTYCVDIANNGDYALNVSKTVTSAGSSGLWDAITLSIAKGSDCTGPGTAVASNTLHAFDGYTANLGPLAKGAHLYLLETLAFPDTGSPQNTLLNQTIAVTENFTGQTTP
jgi:hypothetical protein